jgi:hypothetical protein
MRGREDCPVVIRLKWPQGLWIYEFVTHSFVCYYRQELAVLVWGLSRSLELCPQNNRQTSLRATQPGGCSEKETPLRLLRYVLRLFVDPAPAKPSSVPSPNGSNHPPASMARLCVRSRCAALISCPCVPHCRHHPTERPDLLIIETAVNLLSLASYQAGLN